MLPSQISNWIADICERIESPLEVGVINAISLIGNLIGNKVAIKPKRNDYNYIEYPNLWGMVIGSPAMKKTPIFNEISKSVTRIQAKESLQYAKDIEQYIDDMNLYNIKKKEFERSIKNTTDNENKTFEIDAPIKPIRTVRPQHNQKDHTQSNFFNF